MEHPKNKFNIGDLVVIKSYPNVNPLVGDPLHVPPIMCVVGIEIENKNKKTHDTALGVKIAERVKYSLIWFDNKKSDFIEKIMYESFLYIHPSQKKSKTHNKSNYSYGGVAIFKTQSLELSKSKKSTSTTSSEDQNKIKSDTNFKKTDITPLVTYTSPDFVITGIKLIDENEKYDNKGNMIKQIPEILVKIMWFNPYQQKYSEFEIPKECLINKENKESMTK